MRVLRSAIVLKPSTLSQSSQATDKAKVPPAVFAQAQQ
jgi:hypothetical protein